MPTLLDFIYGYDVIVGGIIMDFEAEVEKLWDAIYDLQNEMNQVMNKIYPDM